MTLLALLGVLILFGVLLWGVSALPWIDAGIKKLIYIIVVIVLVIWLLQAFGILPALGSVRIR